MRMIEQFVSSALTGTVGWALLHSLWEGTIIAVLLATAMIGIRSPRTRYALACAAMVAMFLSFGLTLAKLMPEQARDARVLNALHPLGNMLSGNNSAESSNFNLSTITPWLGSVWLLGVWFMCVWRAASLMSVQRLRHRGVCAASDRWQEKVATLSRQLRLARTVLLVESCLTEVPIVLGHFRPLILLPAGLLTGLPADQIDAILLHELAHIQRHDYFVNVLQRLAEAFFFYHPAAWWISKVIRTEREHCCDDIVVSLTGNAREYSMALTTLEEKRLSSREAALAATGGNLVKRIHRMLDPRTPRMVWAPLAGVVVLLVSAAATMAAWQLESRGQQPNTITSRADETASPSYTKWLDEDVIYILNDAERAAFLQLTTDQERHRFVEEFWERHNPTPGSSPNKFKEEHYRRIAYANQHFRTASGTPGWKTDRGHIYIVYGPPDELEVHPKKAEGTFSTEVWSYRRVEGIGNNGTITFIDKTGQGDFHLAPGNAAMNSK